MFKLLYYCSCSACFEFENNMAYFSKEANDIYLDSVLIYKSFDKNIFSIFNLKPNTKYTISVKNFEVAFTTKIETSRISVKDFGAVADGITLDTIAIQTAINAVKSGGTVIVPAGVYYTGPITLKSNMTLFLEKGSVLLASTNVLDYAVLPSEVFDYSTGKDFPHSVWEGETKKCYQSFISAYNCQDVHIVGEGELNGNANNSIWYDDVKKQVIGRPRLCFFNNCQNVFLHGISGFNSASWNIHPFLCQNIGLYDFKIYADKNSPNTDGCNPEMCDGVKIIGAEFSVGDDCIALKSGKVSLAKKYNTACKNITIRNCLMMFGHGAVVLGSEMSGGIKDIKVSQCYFKKTDRGLRVKTRRGRGSSAIIDNIKFENIIMKNVLTPFTVNMYYFCDIDGKTEYVQSKEIGKFKVDENTPYLGSFTFKNIKCSDCEYSAGQFWGLPEQPIKEVNIEDVSFSFKQNASSGKVVMMCDTKNSSKEGLYFFNVNSINIKNVSFDGVDGETVLQHGAISINQENVTIK